MSNELFSIEDELLALRDKINALHAAISSGRAALNVDPRVVHVEDFSALASEELRERSRRAAHFPDALFGEPAWDILLDLYVHACKGQDVSVSSACLAAQVPPTTGLRWVGLLEAEGLIARRPSQTDRRTVILDLTADGRARIERTLSERLHRRAMALMFRTAPTGTGSDADQEKVDKLLIIQPDDPSISH